jgi:hypothetical protein
MNFKKTTDRLFERAAHAQPADALDVSVALIRQARLNPRAKSYRAPPERWKTPVIRPAEPS